MPMPSASDGPSPCLLEQISQREMMMQLTMISGTYGPSASLISGMKAARNLSAMVDEGGDGQGEHQDAQVRP